jgi:hypothetical protein
MVRDNPRFVEFTTWNDYLEGTYLGGPYPNSDLWPTFRGNDLSHNAYREIAEYYIRWYETGQQPQMTTDKVAIAHRLHPENAPGVNINGTGIGDDTDSAFTNSGGIRPLVRQTDYSVVEDRLYAAVILKQPAQVRLTSGTATQTFEVQGG